MACPTSARRPATRPARSRAWAAALAAAVAGGLLAGGCGRVAPRYEPASLTVTSEPPGATIILDGRPTGQVTPHTFAGLSPASHLVAVELDQWSADPGQALVDLEPLEDALVTFALFQTGLRVTSDPAGARILVDGVDTGRVTPAIVAGLPAGPATVSLELDSWLCVPESAEVEVVEGAIVDVPDSALALRSRRTVLVEAFGNVNCPTCPQAAAAVNGVAATEGYGPGRLLYLEYAVNWPSPTDPFYLANPAENADRYLFYWVMGAPAIYVDGLAQGAPLDQGATAAAVAGRWAADPGFLVDVDVVAGGGSLVRATVTLVPRVGVDLGGCVLQAVLYEDLVSYAEPPGSNGQKDFHHVFRDRVDAPPALGTLEPGLPFAREFELSRGAAGDADVAVVAFVQRLSDRAVLQAGSSLVPAATGAADGKGGR